jgi:hypothetical protein
MNKTPNTNQKESAPSEAVRAIQTLKSVISSCLSIDIDYNRTPMRLQMREDAWNAIKTLEGAVQ